MSGYNFYKCQFYSNSSINPETKRKIKINGYTYNKLCKKYGAPPQKPLLNAQRFNISTYCGITGIKDVDKEILILLKFETLFNLCATNKTLKSLIEELLPDLLRAHNPDNDDIVVYRLMLDIFQFSDKSLVGCILNTFKNLNSPICLEVISIMDFIKSLQKFLDLRNHYLHDSFFDDSVIHIHNTFATVKATINFVEGMRNEQKKGNKTDDALIDYYYTGKVPQIN
jgi:hypothetical protein